MAALAQGSDLAVTVQGVQMLSIVNQGRAEVLHAAVYDEQQAQQLNAQAAQAVAAAATVQAQVVVQVAALQRKSAQAQAQLTAAQTAYQTSLEQSRSCPDRRRYGGAQFSGSRCRGEGGQ